MSTRANIRSQAYALLRESSSDTSFGDDEINSFINESIKLAAPVIQQPRKFSSGTQVTQGTGSYAVPSDFIALKTAYFGDESIRGDSVPLIWTTEESLRESHPNWRDSTTSSQGRPRYIMLIDDDTFHIFPRPNAAESATGKKLIYNYIFQASDMSSDSDSPDLPLPYHDILKFYVCYLCYLNLGNREMAQKMYEDFIKHHKAIESISTVESQENLSFKWGFDDGVNDDFVGSEIIP